jgi:serine/threonine-protein kinase
MKYVDGLTVEDIIRGLKNGDPEIVARFPMEERARIVRSVLQALEYAHARGVVHRDVKPANVMVGRFGEVVLMDWGIAKSIGAPEAHLHTGELPSAPSATATRMGTMVGTPAYMSPEQFKGELDRIDGRTDVYAAGVLLYELVTLRNEAAALPDVEAVKALVTTRESVWLETGKLQPPADLMWVTWRATQLHPDKRFPSARAMREEMEAVAQGLCRADCEVTTIKRMTGLLGREIDRNPGRALMVTIGGVVGLVVLALVTVSLLIYLAVT